MRRLLIEQLEDRSLLTTISWAIDGDGFWDDAANWSTGSVPTLGDDVVIARPAGAFTVTHRSGSTSVNSITSDEKLIVSGGVLDVAAYIQIDSDLVLSGG